MGTNFYWSEPPDFCGACERGSKEPREGAHIGKRSAAGMYCWDCGVTLCVTGNRGIHYGNGFHDACPKCGAKPTDETWNRSAAGVELGFAKPATEKPTGVRSCSSFSWAIAPDEVARECETGRKVINEYGDEMTGLEFLRMLRSNCPVQFTDSIGREFS